MLGKTLYRIIFLQEEEVYELYTEYLSEDSLVGFIEIESLYFNETFLYRSEEEMRKKFAHVTRVYIPVQHILRIDAMAKTGMDEKLGTALSSNVHSLKRHPVS